jgi:polyisoprenyl-phosphate glycosyltransferase
VSSAIDITIVVPCFNEEACLDAFFMRIYSVLEKIKNSYEIICINDGSSDNSLDKLLEYRKSDLRIKIINFSRNFGKEMAITAGLHHASGNVVIPIDCDMQDPPELIPLLLDKWREGYEIVYAKRQRRHGETLFKRLTANLFYRVINILSDIPIPKDTGDFRLLDRKVVEVLNRLPEQTRFMKGLFAWVGFKQTTVAFDRQSRYAGKTKMNFWKLWNFALDGITVFSTSALRIWTYIGFTISFLSFMYSLFLIIRVFVLGKDVPGYASLMVSLLFLGGLILISLGIIGEYLGRIYEEVKKRPLYVIRETFGFKQEPLGSQNGKGSLLNDGSP